MPVACRHCGKDTNPGLERCVHCSKPLARQPGDPLLSKNAGGVARRIPNALAVLLYAACAAAVAALLARHLREGSGPPAPPGTVVPFHPNGVGGP